MSIFPVSFNRYWFVTAFIILMLLVPFINRILVDLPRKQCSYLLLVCVIINGVFPLLNNHVASETVGFGIVATAYLIT